MINDHLSFVERMERLHVLSETKQLLQQKLEQHGDTTYPIAMIEEDLRKIDDEIESYMLSKDHEIAESVVNKELMYPSTFDSPDDLRE